MHTHFPYTDEHAINSFPRIFLRERRSLTFVNGPLTRRTWSAAVAKGARPSRYLCLCCDFIVMLLSCWLQIVGSNFGASGATVYIGALLCGNPLHDANTPDSVVVGFCLCMLIALCTNLTS